MNWRTQAALIALAGGLAATPAAAQQRLVINSFGGMYEEAHRQYVIEPFERLYNVQIDVVTAYSADAMAQLRAQRENPQFDVIHFSGGQEVAAAAEGLLVPIRPDQLTHYDEMYPFAIEGLELGAGPVYSVAVVGIIYNTEEVETPPTSWEDLFDPDLAEYVTLTDFANTYGLFGILMLNQVRGGSLDDIQPGLDAARELLDGGAQIVTSSPEIQAAFAQGTAYLAPYAQDYAHTLQAAGLPVAFALPEEGAPASFLTVNAVAGRPNTELAIAFVDFSIRAEAQAGWAEALRYSPTNSTVELSPEVAAQVTYGDEAVAGLFRFDPTVVNERRSEWTDAWNRLIAR